MGWCSFLLIGHWSRRQAHVARPQGVPRDPARRHRLRPRCHRPGGRCRHDEPGAVEPWAGQAGHRPSRAAPLPLVIVGVLGKSAPLPFQDWLADAMEGPRLPAPSSTRRRWSPPAARARRALPAAGEPLAGCSASRCPSPCSSPPFSPSPRATSRAARLVDRQPGGGHARRPRRRCPEAGPDAPACSTCGRTPCSRRSSSSPSGGPVIAERHRRAGPCGAAPRPTRCCGSPSSWVCSPSRGCRSWSVGCRRSTSSRRRGRCSARRTGPSRARRPPPHRRRHGAYCTRAYLLLTAHVRPVRSRRTPSRSRCRGCCGFSWS